MGLQAEARDLQRKALVDAAQEASDQRRGHGLAHVLRVLHPLERDADDAALMHHGPAAVAAVDRGVDGHGEQVPLGVRVALDLDP